MTHRVAIATARDTTSGGGREGGREGGRKEEGGARREAGRKRGKEGGKRRGERWRKGRRKTSEGGIKLLCALYMYMYMQWTTHNNIYMYEYTTYNSDLEYDPRPEYLYSGGGSHLLQDLHSASVKRGRDILYST